MQKIVRLVNWKIKISYNENEIKLNDYKEQISKVGTFEKEAQAPL